MKSIHHQSNRFVLGRSPREDDVQSLSDDRGWPRVREIQDDPDAGESYQVVWAIDQKMILSYIEDAVSHNCYITVAGESEEQVADISRELGESLDAWDARRLFLSIEEETDPQQKARAVIRAGLGAPDEFDESFFCRIRDAFTDPEPWVREAAVWATVYSPWPQYRPLLASAAQDDPEEKIRDDAGDLLRGLDETGADGQ
jgi:hypothetical protein